MISTHIMSINEPELIFCTQLNGLIYFYLIRIILLAVDNLFSHSLMLSRIAN